MRWNIIVACVGKDGEQSKITLGYSFFGVASTAVMARPNPYRMGEGNLGR